MNVAAASTWAVLCHPEDPRNIGASVRAVANFGLAGLRLVSASPPDLEALHHFSSGALGTIVLEHHTAVRDAVRDAALTLATSRRPHNEDAPAGWNLADLASRLAGHAPVCILFGHERNGLSRDEMDFADALVTIPTSEVFPSMNLGHAVAVVGYELSRADPSAWREAPSSPPGRATSADREGVFREIAAVCEAIGYPPGRSPLRFARRLRRLLMRAEANPAELSLVAGVFRELKRRGSN